MGGTTPEAIAPPHNRPPVDRNRWRLQGWGFPRSLDDVRFVDVAPILLVALTVWGYVDVTRRGRILPGNLEAHRTDFTVFTEAGAAFFDGRNPYHVTNPRGWFYLYPPLFGLMVAPLHVLDGPSQVGVWYAISVLLGFGCYFESRRLWQFLAAGDSGPGSCASTRAHLGLWVGVCAALAVLLPALECLQRGQLGIALLYPLLLGVRLVLTARSCWLWLLGGIVLAWPVVVKVIPALPVGLLMFQLWTAALAPGRRPGSVGRATACSLGLATGALLFVLIIPAVCLGWNQNLRHLQTWAAKVAANNDVGREAKFHIDSIRNQSLGNAAHLLVDELRRPANDRTGQLHWLLADTLKAARRRADQATERVVQIARLGVLVMLGVLGLLMGLRRDLLGQAVAFSLACLATLLVSPLAWTHYYVFLQPALVLMPLWIARKGNRWTIWSLPLTAVLLVWTHYLAMSRVGSLGLLGLGTTAWFLLTCAICLLARRTSPQEKPPARSKRRIDRGHKTATGPRGIRLLADSQNE